MESAGGRGPTTQQAGTLHPAQEWEVKPPRSVPTAYHRLAHGSFDVITNSIITEKGVLRETIAHTQQFK